MLQWLLWSGLGKSFRSCRAEGSVSRRVPPNTPLRPPFLLLAKCLMTPSDRLQRLGFTLTELLVTVAIIAILATLLLGALSQAKAKGQSVICRGNLRQQALGFKMAVDSDSGRLQYRHEDVFGQSAQFKWWTEDWGVASKASVCPSAPDRRTSQSNAALAGYPNIAGTVDSAWVTSFVGFQTEGASPHSHSAQTSVSSAAMLRTRGSPTLDSRHRSLKSSAMGTR